MQEINANEFNEHSLAYELLVELKHSAKRWFVAFCVMVGLEIATIVGFMWYISLPVEEYSEYEQSVEQVEYSNVRQIMGDDYGDSETTEDNIPQESNSQ